MNNNYKFNDGDGIFDQPMVVGTVSNCDTLNQPIDLFSSSCDIVELRSDLLPVDKKSLFEFCNLLEGNGIRTIFTPRLTTEGGCWETDDEERLVVYKEAMQFTSIVDIELSSKHISNLVSTVNSNEKSIILSYHNFERTPCLTDLKKIIRKMEVYEPTIGKIATRLHSHQDVLTLCDLLRDESSIRKCVLGMGPLGVKTRVLYPLLGSCLTYGFLDQSVAPGQIKASKLSGILKCLMTDTEKPEPISKKIKK